MGLYVETHVDFCRLLYFIIQRAGSEQVVVEPGFADAQGKAVVVRVAAQGGEGRQFQRQARTVEQNSQAQRENGKPYHRVVTDWVNEFAQITALAERQQRHNALLFARKTGHVGLADDVGGMLVVAGVGDVYAYFVQKPSPQLVADRV